MDSTYEQTTEVRHEPSAIGPHPEYLRSTEGILKIVQIVLDLIVLICACYWGWPGQGWVEFVAVWALVTTVVWLVFHFLHLIPKLPGPWILIEWIVYLGYCILYVVAIIVSAVKSDWHGSVIATCIFCCFALLAYSIDTWMAYRTWQIGGRSQAVTTTTTTTTYEQKAQY